MLRFSDIEVHGWTVVTGITCQSELLELARSIGKPVPSPTGEIVKELVPTSQGSAQKGTLSQTYGTGSFPLHTDTAFWPVPTRYVVFRVRGDVRRPTKILTFADLFREGGPDITTLANRSIWLVRTQSRNFYCSMSFRSSYGAGFRHDRQCMFPVNNAAIDMQELLCSANASSQIATIDWTFNMAVVIHNWAVLHGRGPSPPNESGRILERVYVE